MPAWCALISEEPKSGDEPNGEGKLLTVKSQMNPAVLFRIASSAMKTTT